jgi:hypothetical protein
MHLLTCIERGKASWLYMTAVMATVTTKELRREALG